MRLVVDGQSCDEVLLQLTEAEARELHDTLALLLADPTSRHEHVASADFQTQVALWLDRGPGDLR